MTLITIPIDQEYTEITISGPTTISVPRPTNDVSLSVDRKIIMLYVNTLTEYPISIINEATALPIPGYGKILWENGDIPTAIGTTLITTLTSNPSPGADDPYFELIFIELWAADPVIYTNGLTANDFEHIQTPSWLGRYSRHSTELGIVVNNTNIQLVTTESPPVSINTQFGTVYLASQNIIIPKLVDHRPHIVAADDNFPVTSAYCTLPETANTSIDIQVYGIDTNGVETLLITYIFFQNDNIPDSTISFHIASDYFLPKSGRIELRSDSNTPSFTPDINNITISIPACIIEQPCLQNIGNERKPYTIDLSL